MQRDEMRRRLEARADPWDLIVVGGGATGAGIAVDGAARGYDVLLLEQADFGQGTSSRSTKLVHGGVRYLRQGNIPLVMEALRERGLLRRNAPHHVADLRFIVPNYDWWEAPFYGLGLKVYDVLAREYRFGPSRLLSLEETLAAIPTLRTEGLRGGVQYYDGQFDDARLLIDLVRTAADHGATVLNHAPVVGLLRAASGYVAGVRVRDAETGREHEVRGRAVINATGPFTDAVRRLDDPAAKPMIAPSQGVHLVLPREYLPGESAIMVPHTRDGRVMFAVPWHNRALVGTTDVPVARATLEPRPRDEEIDFILDTARDYLARPPTRADVVGAFAGIRPLVAEDDVGGTAALSREHSIVVSPSGLITIAGGKWTTYRRMAEDCVDQAIPLAGLDPRPAVTRALPIHGACEGGSGPFRVYGTDAPALERLMRDEPALAAPLHDALPLRAAQVAWAARFEMARTVEDVLARRTRALPLAPAAAREMAPAVAAILAAELGRDEAWQREQVRGFDAVAAGYLVA